MPHFAPSHRLIRNIVDLCCAAPHTVLDYGCGDGLIIEVLGANKIRSYDGFDTSQSSIDAAKKKFNQQNFSFESIKQVPKFKEDSYTLILMVGVLQYVPNNEVMPLLKKLKKSLKKNGVLIITTTSDHWLYTMTDLYSLFLPHKRFSKLSLKRMLNEAGFNKVVVRERGFFLAPIFSHLLTPFLDGFDRVVLGHRGGIGPVGNFVRQKLRKSLYDDFFTTKDYGYTSFVVAKA